MNGIAAGMREERRKMYDGYEADALGHSGAILLLSSSSRQMSGCRLYREL
jgi:hypothetical protein